MEEKIETKRGTVIVVTGATGVGKSNLIYQMPTSTPVEIINYDSRQVYKGFNIGTAMPTPDELSQFQHHNFSYLNPQNKYSAGLFCSAVKKLLPDIIARGNVPVLVGGTFFYIKALWDGLIDEPEIPDSVTKEIEGMNTEQVYQKLLHLSESKQVIQKISENDDYRLRRALSIHLATGKPMIQLEKQGGIFNDYDFSSYWIDMPRKLLYDRINKRTVGMIESGLLDEINNLIKEGLDENTEAMKSIGYREFWQICAKHSIDPGQWKQEHTNELIEVTSQHSRNYAKRQLTWFRNEKRLKRIDLTCNNFLLSEKVKEVPLGH